MANSVGSNNCRDWAQQANESCKTDIAPPVDILEVSEDHIRLLSRTHNPKDDQECEESEDVEGERKAFDKRKFANEVGVEKDAEQGDGDGKKGAVPALDHIVRIAE